MMIYLDNCATTKVSQDVFEAMSPYFMEIYGNPDSKFYEQAEKSKIAVEKARKQIAALFNCDSQEIIFNSGSTEGANTVLKGIASFNHNECKIITTCIEHSATYKTCEYLKTIGVDVKYLMVDSDSLISTEDLKNEIDSKTKLVSIIWVNNETGSIQPIEEVAKLCYDKNIPLHVDATQAVGRIKINLKKIPGISFITFSGHKIFGPKGIGVQINRKSKEEKYYDFIPLIHGGDQENGYRSGTLNVPGIVGIGKACEILTQNINSNIDNLIKLTKKLESILQDKFGDLVVKNFHHNIAPGIINVRFKNINNEILLKNVSKYISMSSGSACSNLKTSRILKATGMSEKVISESIRISLSPYIQEEELNIFNEM